MEALGADRRRDLVPPRRQGPRHPHRAHPPPARRREPVVGHARSRGTPRREARDGADVRRSGAHDGRRPTRASLPSRTGSCACAASRSCAPSASPAPRQAQPHPALLDLDGLRGIVVCPSNPFVSVAPILAVPGVRAALDRREGAAGRRDADRRRPGDQGPGGEDAGRARPRRLRAGRRALLQGLGRRLRARCPGRRASRATSRHWACGCRSPTP